MNNSFLVSVVPNNKTLLEFFESWIELVKPSKPITLADLDENCMLYQMGQLYRKSQGKTIDECPDSSISIIMLSNNDINCNNENIIIETSVTFTIHNIS